MSIGLRKIIRALILEGFVEDWNKEIVADPRFKSHKKYQVSGNAMMDSQYRPWSKTSALRRKTKQIFRKYANIPELNRELECIHWLNFIPASRSTPIDEKLYKFLDWYPPGPKRHTNEISCIGYTDHKVSQPYGIGVILDDKHITFAAKEDAWSEETKYAYRGTDTKGEEINNPFVLVDNQGQVVAASYDETELKLGPLNTLNPDTGKYFLPLRRKFSPDPEQDWRANNRAFEENIRLTKEDALNRKTFYAKLVKTFEKEIESGKYTLMPIFKFYENSGIPKRPSLRVDPNNVVLELSDIDKKGWVEEIICDNWSYSKIYLGPDIIISNETLEELENKNLEILRRL